MAKTNVSIYLAKEGKTHDDIVLGLAHTRTSGKKSKPTPLSQEIPGVGTLYYRETLTRAPEWVGSFFRNEIDETAFRTASSAAVLLMEVRGRTMALTFGNGRFLLDTAATEERFGLRVLLNSCEEGCFRKVNSTTIAGNASKVAEQMPRRSKFSDFSLDSITDTLDKVVATPQDDDLFSGTMTGDDKLSFVTDGDMRTIAKQLDCILDRYESSAYKEKYPWVDYVVPVSDKEAKRRLEDKAVSLLNARSKDLWTAPPELIESWDRIAGFKWPGCNGELMPDVLVEDVLSTIGDLTDFNQLKNKYVEAMDKEDISHHLYRWSIAKCLCGEIDLDGEQYCTSAGKWYRISQDYAKRVNEDYDNSPCFDNRGFPECEGEPEGKYNQRLADSNPDYLLMDAKTIAYGYRQSSIELCDVLAGNDTFIHVKHYCGSATLSHLFNQGLNSAELVSSDPTFVEKANVKIRKQPGSGGHEIETKCVRTVVYAIICDEPASPPRIPFFSRITYNRVAKTLGAMGIDCRICAIRRPKKEQRRKVAP